MVRWRHWLEEHELEQGLGVDDGQGSLVCCSPWGRKGLYTTEWLNWTEVSLLWKIPRKAYFPCKQVASVSLEKSHEITIGQEGNGTPLQYACQENPMDGGAWWAAVHEVAKSRTRLSDFTFTFHFYALEKEMATHSRVLAWRIPGMGEPGGLLSMGLHRVRHDWSDLAAAGPWTFHYFNCIITINHWWPHLSLYKQR